MTNDFFPSAERAICDIYAKIIRLRNDSTLNRILVGLAMNKNHTD